MGGNRNKTFLQSHGQVINCAVECCLVQKVPDRPLYCAFKVDAV